MPPNILSNEDIDSCIQKLQLEHADVLKKQCIPPNDSVQENTGLISDVADFKNSMTIKLDGVTYTVWKKKYEDYISVLNSTAVSCTLKYKQRVAYTLLCLQYILEQCCIEDKPDAFALYLGGEGN